MDYKRILAARENRKTRFERPFSNFFETFKQCISAGEAVLDGSAPSGFSLLLERTAVISTVTAIEVYYRDMFDFILRSCEPEFFEPKLQSLHPEKYDIMDLLAVYDHQIHPLELVSASQSFQNVERIERVFSKFLKKGMWSSVLSLQIRRKDDPDSVATWTADDLSGLKDTFTLRHQLVHDPANTAFINADTIKKLWQSSHMVFGSDFVLGQMLTDNSVLPKAGNLESESGPGE